LHEAERELCVISKSGQIIPNTGGKMAIFATQKSDGSVTLPVNVVLFASYVLLILIVSLSMLIFFDIRPIGLTQDNVSDGIDKYLDVFHAVVVETLLPLLAGLLGLTLGYTGFLNYLVVRYKKSAGGEGLINER
jgi:hypothetical protein